MYCTVEYVGRVLGIIQFDAHSGVECRTEGENGD